MEDIKFKLNDMIQKTTFKQLLKDYQFQKHCIGDCETLLDLYLMLF